MISNKYIKQAGISYQDIDLAISKAILDGISDKNLAFTKYPGRNYELFQILGLRIQVLSDNMYMVLFRERLSLCKNIEVGDVIIEVNGVSPGKFIIDNSIDEILLNAIRYKNENTPETIIVSEKVIINRSYTKLKCSFQVRLQNDEAIIKIYYFDNKDIENLISETRKIYRSNIKKIVLDLRDNGGGDFDSTIRFLDLFVNYDDTICYLRDSKNDCYAVTANTKEKLGFEKIIIYINAGTASSAELVAIVLREIVNAEIYGDRSYGKGVVQKFICINEMICMYLPIYEFLSPNFNSISCVGVEPVRKKVMVQNR